MTLTTNFSKSNRINTIPTKKEAKKLKKNYKRSPPPLVPSSRLLKNFLFAANLSGLKIITAFGTASDGIITGALITSDKSLQKGGFLLYSAVNEGIYELKHLDMLSLIYVGPLLTMETMLGIIKYT